MNVQIEYNAFYFSIKPDNFLIGDGKDSTKVSNEKFCSIGFS
jgi:hypothetical protein